MHTNKTFLRFEPDFSKPQPRKYVRHQGAKECARRLRQFCSAYWLIPNNRCEYKNGHSGPHYTSVNGGMNFLMETALVKDTSHFPEAS